MLTNDSRFINIRQPQVNRSVGRVCTDAGIGSAYQGMSLDVQRTTLKPEGSISRIVPVKKDLLSTKFFRG
jgi:hypothetical protein